MNLSNSQEEYLKTIYLLQKTNNEVKVTEIAKKLNKTKASVNYAINSLKNDNLIEYEPYTKIKLTTEGEKEAIKVIEANDIVKLFLTDIINVNSEIAGEEANKIKTILSDDTLNKLARFTYKTLGITDIDCQYKYDINNKKCLECKRTKIKNSKEIK